MIVKRAFDLLAGTLALAVLSPLLFVTGVLVKLTSPGPVFHRGIRVGLGGRPFRLYKFRSMRVGTSGPPITSRGDPRVTPVGKWLRRWKVDELPQLWNVVRGDMSLVGPRPEDPAFVALYTPEERAVLSVRPGITSEASVRFRDEEDLLDRADWEKVYRTVLLPEKLRLDLEYARRRTFAGDLRLLFRTGLQVLRLSRS